jgi:hypothetical protein
MLAMWEAKPAPLAAGPSAMGCNSPSCLPQSFASSAEVDPARFRSCLNKKGDTGKSLGIGTALDWPQNCKPPFSSVLSRRVGCEYFSFARLCCSRVSRLLKDRLRFTAPPKARMYRWLPRPRYHSRRHLPIPQALATRPMVWLPARGTQRSISSTGTPVPLSPSLCGTRAAEHH